MSIVIYHHPFTRAATTLWMLEEVGVPHELRFVDVMANGQKADDILALNPMGKLPILVDGDAIVTETAAIGLYLADRYAAGRLAPALDDPRRGAYLRWSLFAPSVIEPGAAARASGGNFNASAVGWGTWEAMLASMEHALKNGPYLLGESFSMADIIFGGTTRFLLRFKMLEPREAFTAYVERLSARPALQRADARNAAISAERGLNR